MSATSITASRSISRAPRTDCSASIDCGGRRSIDIGMCSAGGNPGQARREYSAPAGARTTYLLTDIAHLLAAGCGLCGRVSPRLVDAPDDPDELSLDTNVDVELRRVLLVGGL